MAQHDPAPRLLDVIDHDILPLTERGVAAGNKVFGAAILRKSDLSLVDRRAPTTRPRTRCGTARCTHSSSSTNFPTHRRPAIWCSCPPTSPARCACRRSPGPGSTTSTTSSPTRIPGTAFAIPHDLKILNEVFGLEPGGYRRTNAFWTAYSIPALVESEPEPLRTQLREQEQQIRDRYDALSRQYQDSKGDNDIPLS